MVDDIFWGEQSVGADGSYIYVPERLGRGSRESKLFFYDLSDRSVGPIEQIGEGSLARPAFSPDGTSVAVQVQSYSSMWEFVSEYDLETGLFRRRSFGNRRQDPDWSPDGSFLYYDGWTSTSPGIYRQAADVLGEDILVLEGEGTSPNLSPDGDWLAFSRDSDVLIHNLHSGMESILDSLEGIKRHPDFSPDSRYVAFETDVSGIWDVAIRPITGTAYAPISYPNARRPKWGPHGKYVYFLVISDGIYRLPVTTEPFFEVRGEAQKIISIHGLPDIQWFDVSPDGNTLAITASRIQTGSNSAQQNYSTLMWWRNWAQSLKDE